MRQKAIGRIGQSARRPSLMMLRIGAAFGRSFFVLLESEGPPCGPACGASILGKVIGGQVSLSALFSFLKQWPKVKIMVKAVFIQSSHSGYDDQPGKAYHFPKKHYLSRVEQTVGDWVIFYEGRRGGGRGYHAVQRVLHVRNDPSDPEMAYAVLDIGSELSFENLVPRWVEGQGPFETGLPRSRGSNTSAVRLISDKDFARIINAGLEARKEPNAIPRTGDINAGLGFADARATFDPQYSPREMLLFQRAFRERSFARQVKHAYGGRCSMSGLELRNGGGRPEVEAAHIVPVSEQGPDTVRNGLALSGTVHWMFDRGLLSISDEHEVLVAKNAVDEATLDRLLLPDRRLIDPVDQVFKPHKSYLRWHRENVFKG
ncbi:HNH endonuclease [Phaeobacter inhibens]|nr:HNH endonuclease [Phaeobacter inhibens]AUR08559.1 HNH endonuclease [Phaeobacter inhibens]AUR12393.1 HNH endonuclease [Phaeobacter inhibens]